MRCRELPSRIFLIVTLLVVAISGAVAQTSESTARHEIDGIVSVEIPTDATLSVPSKGPDFDVHFVVRDGKRILGLYLGRAADFSWKGVEFKKIGRCLAFVAINGTQDSQNGDVLLPMICGDSIKQVHMFYRDAKPDVADQASKSIASIRVLEPRTCIMEHSPERR